MTGRFLPGASGNPNGRPRGYDFRKIVAEHVAANGCTVEQAVADLFDSLRDTAKGGDGAAVAAAKLLLDRLCDQEPQQLDVHHSGEVATAGPIVPATVDLLSGVRKLAELAEELVGQDGEATA